MRRRATIPTLEEAARGPDDIDFQCGVPPEFEAEQAALLGARPTALATQTRPYSAACSRRHTALRTSGTRAASSIRLIVLHSTEGSTAAGAAGWFTNPEAQGSAHLCVDDEECYRTLAENVIPWGAKGANTSGLHVEIAGFAAWSKQEWLEHTEGLRRAAFKAAQLAKKYGIPLELLSNRELERGQRGFVTHAQCAAVFGGTHTDPGSGFPLDRFMGWAREFSGGKPGVPEKPEKPDKPDKPDKSATPAAPGQLTPRSTLLAPPRASAEALERYVLKRDHAPRTDAEARTIVGHYVQQATAGGLDPLIPVAQMVLETNNLKSAWSQPPFRNFAGIGITSDDADPDLVPRFKTWKAAVRAHVGRLVAYTVPAGQETPAQAALIEAALKARPLSAAVRGQVKTVGGLEGTWATGADYAKAVSRIANEIRKA